MNIGEPQTNGDSEIDPTVVALYSRYVSALKSVAHGKEDNGGKEIEDRMDGEDLLGIF